MRQGTTPALSALAVVIIGLSLIGAILYEVAKRREEAAAQRMQEKARLAERGEIIGAKTGLGVKIKSLETFCNQFIGFVRVTS